MRGRPPHISEERLLDAAAEVFLRRGASATTAEIARQAGVSEGLLFYRYATKDDLIAAVIERQLRLRPELIELIRDPGDRPVADMLHELGAQILSALRRTLPFVEVARSSPEAARIARSLAWSGATPDRLVDLAARYFEAEAARGRLRPVPPSVAARLLVGAALERTMAEHAPMAAAPLDGDDAFLRGVVDVLLHGAAPGASARGSR